MGTEELIRSLASGLAPVRRLPAAGSRTLRWGTCALACVCIGVRAFGPRSDLSRKMQDPVYLRELTLLLAMSLVSAWTAFSLGIPGEGRGRGSGALAIAASVAWTALVVVHPAAATGAASGWPCVLRMACLGLVPAAAALSMVRRAAPLLPGWTGLFAVFSAACLALLGSRVLCGKDDPGHLLLWHFVPLVVSAFAGIHLGRLLLARPDRPVANG